MRDHATEAIRVKATVMWGVGDTSGTPCQTAALGSQSRRVGCCLGLRCAPTEERSAVRPGANVRYWRIVLKNPEIQFLENQAEVPSWADF